MENNKLTKQEIYFCELYVCGDAPYTGNASKCFKEAFSAPDDKTTRMKAMRFMKNKDIQAYIEELTEMTKEERKDMKTFLTENLMHIVEECSTAEYRDRRGTRLSPAPLRSVAVGAAKVLADMYPVKEATEHKLTVGEAGEGGITFNLIMPEQTKDVNTNQEE